MSRQAWLRDPDRPRIFGRVDTRPHSAAVLDRRADSMREMVREHVDAQRRQLADEQLPDDEFDILEEGLLDDEEEIVTPHQVTAFREYLEAEAAAEPNEEDATAETAGDETLVRAPAEPPADAPPASNPTTP